MPVFSLEEVKVLQVKNIVNRNSLSWPEYSNYGYLCGGISVPGSLFDTGIFGHDYSTNTVSQLGTFDATGASHHGTTKSLNNAYIMGGTNSTSSFDTYAVRRFQFSTSIVSSPGISLPAGRTGYFATVETPTYGYVGGGQAYVFPGQFPLFSTISRLDFSNETFANPGKNLPTALRSYACVQTNTYGYFGGGTSVCTINRLDFSNETVSAPGKNLPSSRSSLSGMNNVSYGYFGGGLDPGSPGSSSTILRLEFSNETVSAPGKNLPSNSTNTTDTGTNGSIYGHMYDATSAYRFDYSTENASLLLNNLPSRAGRNAFEKPQFRSSTKTSKSYGYFGGGSTPTYICTITRLDFSNETVSNPGKNLPTSRGSLAAVSSNYYGYFGGGFTPPYICTITRLDFSNEIVSNPGKNLPTVRTTAAVSSSSYGYFGGGFFTPPTTYICTITRLDFSNETVSNPGNNLPTSRSSLATVSSNSYGYFGGGVTPPYICTITRLDFSNETVSDPGKNLPSERSSLAATSSSSYGYFGGGFFTPPTTYICTITRLDFSNETVSNPGNNLPTSTRGSSATSSSFYGYFGGGLMPPGVPPTVYVNTVSRLDFSSETVSLPTKNLPSARSFLAALSNSN
jgi:hypothetical protein